MKPLGRLPESLELIYFKQFWTRIMELKVFPRIPGTVDWV